MEAFKYVKLALNIADFMQKFSQYVNEQKDIEQERILASKKGGWDVPHDDISFSEMESIGFDDTMQTEIIIDLSQNRRNFKIWTPYNEKYKKELMTAIPKNFRAWDRSEKCWRVHIDWIGNAQHLLLEYFPDYERRYSSRALTMCETIAEQQEEEEMKKSRKKQGHQRNKKKQKQRKQREGKTFSFYGYEEYEEYEDEDDRFTDEDPYEILGVQDTASDTVIKTVFKALIREHHADIGGNPAEMARLNAAYEEICKDRGWK